jgi:hypothetical protein
MFHGLEPIYHRAVDQEPAREGRGVSLRFRLLHHIVVQRLIRSSCVRSEKGPYAHSQTALMFPIVRITNAQYANDFLRREYRGGWKVTTV